MQSHTFANLQTTPIRLLVWAAMVPRYQYLPTMFTCSEIVHELGGAVHESTVGNVCVEFVEAGVLTRPLGRVGGGIACVYRFAGYSEVVSLVEHILAVGILRGDGSALARLPLGVAVEVIMDTYDPEDLSPVLDAFYHLRRTPANRVDLCEIEPARHLIGAGLPRFIP